MNCLSCKENEVVGRRRKYCSPECARAPKIQWKREARKISKGSGRYYSDQWGTLELRRAYFRNYMRERRAMLRQKKLKVLALSEER